MEKMLFCAEEIDLAQGALIASGVSDEDELNRYMAKVDHLCLQITQARKGSDLERAREIFHWLWQAKPLRYQYRGSFKLSDVIDTQIGDRDKVGNCLGLTVLYNVLAQRFGLRVKATHLEDAFGIGPHVFTVLRIGTRSIDIENIFPYGFDYRGHKGNPQREEWGDRGLIADIYHSTANDFFEQGMWERAIDDYDKAILLNPKYAKARLNKGIVLAELGRLEEARECFRQATL